MGNQTWLSKKVNFLFLWGVGVQLQIIKRKLVKVLRRKQIKKRVINKGNCTKKTDTILRKTDKRLDLFSDILISTRVEKIHQLGKNTNFNDNSSVFSWSGSKTG